MSLVELDAEDYSAFSLRIYWIGPRSFTSGHGCHGPSPDMYAIWLNVALWGGLEK